MKRKKINDETLRIRVIERDDGNIIIKLITLENMHLYGVFLYHKPDKKFQHEFYNNFVMASKRYNEILEDM